MPNSFAHLHFGDLVFEGLSDENQKRVSYRKDLYLIGIQGPDFIFFYHPLKANHVSAKAHELHNMTGREFFSRAVQEMEKHPDRDAALSYVTGFICHFALDSAGHAFVNRYEKERGICHSDIEGDFDRTLLASLGKDPVKEDFNLHFPVKEDAGRIISPFTNGLDAGTTRKALRMCRSHKALLFCPGAFKRTVILAFLKVAGKYRSNRGQVMGTGPYADTEDSDRELMRLLNEAVPFSIQLISEFIEGTDTGDYEKFFSHGELDATFDAK